MAVKFEIVCNMDRGTIKKPLMSWEDMQERGAQNATFNFKNSWTNKND